MDISAKWMRKNVIFCLIMWKSNWVSCPKIWVSRPKNLGELTKTLGELSNNLGGLTNFYLGELVFGWVVLIHNAPCGLINYSKQYLFFIVIIRTRVAYLVRVSDGFILRGHIHWFGIWKGRISNYKFYENGPWVNLLSPLCHWMINRNTLKIKYNRI